MGPYLPDLVGVHRAVSEGSDSQGVVGVRIEPHAEDVLNQVQGLVLGVGNEVPVLARVADVLELAHVDVGIQVRAQSIGLQALAQVVVDNAHSRVYGH